MIGEMEKEQTILQQKNQTPPKEEEEFVNSDNLPPTTRIGLERHHHLLRIMGIIMKYNFLVSKLFILKSNKL